MNEMIRPLLERVFNILREKGLIPPLWIPRHGGRTFRTTGDSLDKIPAAYFEHRLDKRIGLEYSGIQIPLDETISPVFFEELRQAEISCYLLTCS